MTSLAELAAQEAAGQENPEKENFRSCGRASPPRHAPPRLTKKEKSVPTIPSRFEVTLYEGSREHRGFGFGALRWEQLNPVGDIPGPGEYGRRKAFHEEHDERPSWGIRGTGGFASRSQRFGARSMPTLPKAGRGCPGPGAYDPTAGLKAVNAPKDFNKAKSTSAFSAPAEREKDVVPPPPVPGPGHYGAPKPPAGASMVCAARSAFKSEAERGIVLPTEDMPGPGEYWDGLSKAPLLVADKAGEMSTVHFQQASRRRVVQVHRDLPAADERAREVLGDFGDKVGRVVDGSMGYNKKLPGPGHYDQDRDAIWAGGLVGVSGSSSFQPGPERGNLAPKELGQLPGPGKYNPKTLDTLQVADAKSAFNSATIRIKDDSLPAPGPCYYSPLPPRGARSFMLNAKRQFVP